MPRILSGLLAIVKVRAPIRRYGMALDLLHGLPAAAAALYDPRLGSDRRQPYLEVEGGWGSGCEGCLQRDNAMQPGLRISDR
jgi:hypothetical protein